MTTTTPRPYASHLEAGQGHEDRVPDLCRRGLHLMEGDNIARSVRGTRQCRACKVEATRRWRERHSEEVKAKSRERYLAGTDRRRRYAAERWQSYRRCRHGHVQTPDVEYVRPDGRHECRRCRRRYQRAWRVRRQERK